MTNTNVNPYLIGFFPEKYTYNLNYILHTPKYISICIKIVFIYHS